MASVRGVRGVRGGSVREGRDPHGRASVIPHAAKFSQDGAETALDPVSLVIRICGMVEHHPRAAIKAALEDLAAWMQKPLTVGEAATEAFGEDTAASRDRIYKAIDRHQLPAARKPGSTRKLIQRSDLRMFVDGLSQAAAASNLDRSGQAAMRARR